MWPHWAGSREDLPLEADSADNSKGGYSHYSEGFSHEKLMSSYESNAKFETMEDHQTLPDYKSNAEGILISNNQYGMWTDMMLQIQLLCDRYLYNIYVKYMRSQMFYVNWCIIWLLW